MVTPTSAGGVAVPETEPTLRVTTAADQSALRRAHLGLVLRSLRDHGPRSRSRLSSELGLTRPAASTLVAELVDLGLVREGGVQRGRVGRPGTSVELDGAGVWGIGAEINVDHVATLALDPTGRTVTEGRRGLDSRRLTPHQVVAELADVVREGLDQARAAGATTTGVTVGVAGLVDVTRDLVTFAPNLGWRDLPIAAMLRTALGDVLGPDGPAIHVDNEANLAAIAEIAPGREDLLVLYGEVGVGGGVVTNGQLLRGRHGWAGEVGHIVVEPHGRLCGCGRTGCWETRIGLRAVIDSATDPDDPARNPATPLEQRLDLLADRARRRDGRTLAALEEAGTWLGVGAATLVNVLNPGQVVLSGYFATLAEWLTPPALTQLETGVLAPRAGDTGLVRSELGLAAAVRGAALVSLEPVFADPTIVSRPATPPVTASGGA